jgi:hypothetical protein
VVSMSLCTDSVPTTDDTRQPRCFVIYEKVMILTDTKGLLPGIAPMNFSLKDALAAVIKAWLCIRGRAAWVSNIKSEQIPEC